MDLTEYGRTLIGMERGSSAVTLSEEAWLPANGAFPGIEAEEGIDCPLQKALSLQPSHDGSAAGWAD